MLLPEIARECGIVKLYRYFRFDSRTGAYEVAQRGGSTEQSVFSRSTSKTIEPNDQGQFHRRRTIGQQNEY